MQVELSASRKAAAAEKRVRDLEEAFRGKAHQQEQQFREKEPECFAEY